MEVIAFVGPSGTGKSHRASVIAHENGIEAIIDDGILIFQNRIVAGSSAKKETSRLRAVRRAIFQDKGQVQSVQKELARIQPDKLLILGTSENMVSKITKALAIPMPSRYINIEDVASDKEIEKAQHARLKEGKHVIPVPTMELKPHFQGYLIDPIKSLFRRKKRALANPTEWYEKSVVRPAFSYYGRLTFSDSVIIDLISNAVKKVQGLVSVSDIKIKKSKKGSNGLLLDLALTVRDGYAIKALIPKAQKSIIHEVEYITGMSIVRMQITIKEVVKNNGGSLQQSLKAHRRGEK